MFHLVSYLKYCPKGEDAMHYFASFLMAVFLTSLSYFFGSRLLTPGLYAWQALIIGASVVSLGALAEALKLPIGLIVFIPFPVGMLLLFLFLQQPFRIWLLTYLIILALYTLIHVIASYFFHFHSLIPAWKLS